MERAFKITNKSKMYKELKQLEKNLKDRSGFCKKFFKENNIQADRFYIGGNGVCNQPFDEGNKKDIGLEIDSTIEDEIIFKGQLNKTRTREGRRSFRKSSKLLKKFQDECVKNKVVVNICDVDMRDYFKSIGLMGYSRSIIICEDCYYLKLSSDYLKENDTPDGLEEIKMSEYYRVKESME